MGCIYLLYDDNGNGYIGKTKNVKERLRQHKQKLDKCRSRFLNNFECLVIEEFDDEKDLDYAEQFYYDLYKDLYGDKIVNRCRPLQTEKEYYKKYLEKNKEQKKEQWKEWYKINKEQIAERKKQKITCVCGSVITYREKTRHAKTKKHKNNLSNNN